MRKISSYFTPVRTKKDEKHAADSPVSRRASSFQGQELVVPEETHSIKATTEDRSECNSKVLLESDSQILLGNVFAKSRKKMTVLSAQEETPFPSKRNLNVGSTCNDSILKENFQQPAVPSLFNDDDDDDDFPISKRRRILRSASFVRSQKKNNSRKEDSDSEFKEESDSCLDEDESELDASSEDISPVNCNFDSMDRRPLNKTPQSKKSKIASKNCVEAEADLNFRPSIDGALSSIESKFSSIDFKNGSQMNPLQKSKLMSQDRASACLTNEKNINETVNASWLRNRKDKNGRSPTDPDFDNRTLYIPKASLAMMTPAQRQYWEIKSENMDVVLFFKMGKFYELFDVDAEIGHKELDLMYMKSERPHVGFPEAGFSKFSERLVHLGYKIGRVEQTETPDEMKERNRLLSGKNKSKVVNREMVSLLTKGTLVDPEIIGKDDASYLLSLREGSPGKIGVCFVDTSTGSFSIGEFQDDTSRTLLRTLLAQIRPEEVIYPKGNLTEKTLSTVTKETKKALINVLIDGSEFWDADRSVLEIENYFDQEIPVDLKAVFKSCELSVSAFGGCVWYLRRVLLDQELLSIGHFSLYNPIDETMAEFLILDGHTLSNLEILSNAEGDSSGSLLSYLDHCVTPFGRRTFREWVSKPLARISAIEDRLNAVEDLMMHSDLSSSVRALLKKLPDLERLLARIHSFAIARDKKAIMYENVDKKKLNVFLTVLDGYEKSLDIVKAFETVKDSFKSKKLRRLVNLSSEGGDFPDLRSDLQIFNDAFDRQDALARGFILPRSGFDSEYDSINQRLSEVEMNLNSILKGVQKQFKDSSIKYVHKNKEVYQLEISENTLNRAGQLPEEFEHLSRRKGFQRFWTPEIKDLISEQEKLSNEKESLQNDLSRKFFSRFCEKFRLWRKASNYLAELDCFLNLSIISSFTDGIMCRPEFISQDSAECPFLELRDARHPCVTASRSENSQSFISNDTVIGIAENKASLLLLTGPNMGGKSTLLRQTCVNVVMAQLGCYVPARSCKLTPVDRIFTRVGAHDRILAGQSTFFVELEETASILKHATNHSLVILDELGRGTSTFDGTGIAYAVAKHLSSKLRCRALFSTHYHVLTEDLIHDGNIAMYNMECVVDEKSGEVSFLYKFSKGVCSKSFGMNVARMAGLDESIVKKAFQMSHDFEFSFKTGQVMAMFDKLIQKIDADSLEIEDLRSIKLLCANLKNSS